MTEPTNLDLFVAELKKQAVLAITVHIFKFLSVSNCIFHAKVESLAKHLNSSRNKVLNDLWPLPLIRFIYL